MVFDAMNVKMAEPARQQGEDEVFAGLKQAPQAFGRPTPSKNQPGDLRSQSMISLAFAPGGVKVYDLPPPRAR